MYKLEVYRVDGQWRWKMTSKRNGKIVGASTEAFKNKAGVLKNVSIVTGIDGVEKISRDLYVIEF